MPGRGTGFSVSKVVLGWPWDWTTSNVGRFLRAFGSDVGGRLAQLHGIYWSMYLWRGLEQPTRKFRMIQAASLYPSTVAFSSTFLTTTGFKTTSTSTVNVLRVPCEEQLIIENEKVAAEYGRDAEIVDDGRTVALLLSLEARTYPTPSPIPHSPMRALHPPSRKPFLTTHETFENL